MGKIISRVQFDFTQDALDRMDEIKTKSGATTRAETIRQALRLYEWLLSLPETTQIVNKGAAPLNLKDVLKPE